MKLARKNEGEYKPQYKSSAPVYKKAPDIDWDKMEIDWSATVPYGKYKGYPLSSVRNGDDWYWNWMQDNNIIAEWGMIKEKGIQVSRKIQQFVSHLGEVWIGIREVETNQSTSYVDADGELTR